MKPPTLEVMAAAYEECRAEMFASKLDTFAAKQLAYSKIERQFALALSRNATPLVCRGVVYSVDHRSGEIYRLVLGSGRQGRSRVRHTAKTR